MAIAPGKTVLNGIIFVTSHLPAVVLQMYSLGAMKLQSSFVSHASHTPPLQTGFSENIVMQSIAVTQGPQVPFVSQTALVEGQSTEVTHEVVCAETILNKKAINKYNAFVVIFLQYKT
jgi:hypothetical protein